jgi:predicted AlkP superfamily phosphohydrolase/phosphomutase
MNMQRVVIVALSEASPQLVERLCDQGRMPHTQALRNTGLVGRTRYSTPYLLTPQMWATIVTGRTPGSHGVFDYWQRQTDGTFIETRGRDIRGRRIWDELSDQGIPSGIVNVPMTYPPAKTKGFSVSGQDAPGAHHSIAWPPTFYQELTQHFGRYHHKDIFPGGQTKERYARILPDEVHRQSDLFEWLTRRDDWRFLMLYTSGPAFAQHYFWADMDRGDGPTAGVIDQTFHAADEMVGRVNDILGSDDCIFVMSECGAGPIGGGVRLNTWLHQQGFLEYKSQTLSHSFRAQWLSKLRVAAQRYLPQNLFYLANSLPLKGWIQTTIAGDRIDWSRTVAFHRGKGEGNIYLNVAGRDPAGIVSKSDYERVRTEIIDRLTELRDPKTGSRVATAVHRREEIFSGECVCCAPDLIVEWDGFRYMPSEDSDGSGEIFGDRTREYMTWPTTGSHRPEGLLVARGKGICHRTLASPVELIDLAPTWLSILNCPVPFTMQGQPVPDMLPLDRAPRT